MDQLQVSEPGTDCLATNLTRGGDPIEVALHCAPRLRTYLRSVIANWHDVDDLLQDFFLRGLERGFVRRQPLRGSLENYLKATVRNAAIDYLRRGQRRPSSTVDVALLPGRDETCHAERARLDERCRELLQRAWNDLERHERRSPGNYGHTLLAWSLRYPGLGSEALATRLAARTRRVVSATAVRKQISRARRLFARLLIEALLQTIPDLDPRHLEGELLELGWMPFLRAYVGR